MFTRRARLAMTSNSTLPPGRVQRFVRPFSAYLGNLPRIVTAFVSRIYDLRPKSNVKRRILWIASQVPLLLDDFQHQGRVTAVNLFVKLDDCPNLWKKIRFDGQELLSGNLNCHGILTFHELPFLA